MRVTGICQPASPVRALAMNLACLSLHGELRQERPGPAAPAVSGPSCPSAAGQPRVAVEQDEYGEADREAGKDDSP